MNTVRKIGKPYESSNDNNLHNGNDDKGINFSQELGQCFKIVVYFCGTSYILCNFRCKNIEY